LSSFVTLQFNHYKDNENNVNVSSVDWELFYSYNQKTGLFGTLCFLPQNTPAIFWPGHQASRGWLETPFGEWASPVNAIDQASTLKLNPALGCEVPLSQKN